MRYKCALGKAPVIGLLAALKLEMMSWRVTGRQDVGRDGSVRPLARLRPHLGTTIELSETAGTTEKRAGSYIGLSLVGCMEWRQLLGSTEQQVE